MNTTLSPVTVQRFSALQAELIALLEQDYTGLTPKLERIAFICRAAMPVVGHEPKRGG